MTTGNFVSHIVQNSNAEDTYAGQIEFSGHGTTGPSLGTGKVDYESATHWFAVPKGVKYISVCLIGAGGSSAGGNQTNTAYPGAAGGLRWVNNIRVYPGEIVGVMCGTGVSPLTSAGVPYRDTVLKMRAYNPSTKEWGSYSDVLVASGGQEANNTAVSLGGSGTSTGLVTDPISRLYGCTISGFSGGNGIANLGGAGSPGYNGNGANSGQIATANSGAGSGAVNRVLGGGSIDIKGFSGTFPPTGTNYSTGGSGGENAINTLGRIYGSGAGVPATGTTINSGGAGGFRCIWSGLDVTNGNYVTREYPNINCLPDYNMGSKKYEVLYIPEIRMLNSESAAYRTMQTLSLPRGISEFYQYNIIPEKISGMSTLASTTTTSGTPAFPSPLVTIFHFPFFNTASQLLGSVNRQVQFPISQMDNIAGGGAVGPIQGTAPYYYNYNNNTGITVATSNSNFSTDAMDFSSYLQPSNFITARDFWYKQPSIINTWADYRIIYYNQDSEVFYDYLKQNTGLVNIQGDLTDNGALGGMSGPGLFGLPGKHATTTVGQAPRSFSEIDGYGPIGLNLLADNRVGTVLETSDSFWTLFPPSGIDRLTRSLSSTNQTGSANSAVNLIPSLDDRYGTRYKISLNNGSGLTIPVDSSEYQVRMICNIRPNSVTTLTDCIACLSVGFSTTQSFQVYFYSRLGATYNYGVDVPFFIEGNTTLMKSVSVKRYERTGSVSGSASNLGWIEVVITIRNNNTFNKLRCEIFPRRRLQSTPTIDSVGNLPGGGGTSGLIIGDFRIVKSGVKNKPYIPMAVINNLITQAGSDYSTTSEWSRFGGATVTSLTTTGEPALSYAPNQMDSLNPVYKLEKTNTTQTGYIQKTISIDPLDVDTLYEFSTNIGLSVLPTGSSSTLGSGAITITFTGGTTQEQIRMHFSSGMTGRNFPDGVRRYSIIGDNTSVYYDASTSIVNQISATISNLSQVYTRFVKARIKFKNTMGYTGVVIRIYPALTPRSGTISNRVPALDSEIDITNATALVGSCIITNPVFGKTVDLKFWECWGKMGFFAFPGSDQLILGTGYLDPNASSQLGTGGYGAARNQLPVVPSSVLKHPYYKIPDTKFITNPAYTAGGMSKSLSNPQLAFTLPFTPRPYTLYRFIS